MSDISRADIDEQRTDAAQKEWERWKRVNGVQSIGLRATAEDIRHMANRLDISSVDQRDLLRCADLIAECAHELDGENWLKSPKAMQELRNQENGKR